jgi:hypothetical protein
MALPGGIGIVACVPFIAQIRVAEPWTAWSLIGAAVLVGAIVGVIYAVVARSR